MTPMPEDSYGIAKSAIEQELKVSHEMFGLDYVIFRPHNVYGGKTKHRGPLSQRCRDIYESVLLKGQPMTVFGDGEQQRAFTHINDRGACNRFGGGRASGGAQ